MSEASLPRPSSDRRRGIASVRVPAKSYFAAGFVGTFFSALGFYLGYDLIAAFLLALSLLLPSLLSITDRLIFTEKRLYRSGLLYRGWAYALGLRFWLKLRDIEQVETITVPTVKRGGRVYLRYVTFVRGKGLEFSFASGTRRYRSFVKALFGAVPEEVLDAVSMEVRDYLRDSGETRMMARTSSIPSADVLEQTLRNPANRKDARPARAAAFPSDEALEKARRLRILGNRLRVSGSLLQAMESFRRAATIQPDDAWLLFDFGRCIQSFAASEGDPRLERKAAAMLRLAERRAGGDGLLLARLGESYFQLGDWRRANAAFRKAVDAVGEQFRSIRGLAEIALRDGRLAHVVHNFNAASRLAESPAVRRWSKAEAEYFARLSNDGEYMEMELGRVNLLDALDRWKRTTLRLGIIGYPVIFIGLLFDDAVIANCGWVLSGGMLVLWTAILLATRVFSPRIAPELLEED